MMTGVFVFSHTDLFSVLCLVDVICRTYWIPLFHLVELCCACIPIVLKGESRDSRGSCWERWGGFTFFFLKGTLLCIHMVGGLEKDVPTCRQVSINNSNESPSSSPVCSKPWREREREIYDDVSRGSILWWSPGCLFVDPLVTIVLHSDAGAREGDPFRVMETHSSLASRDCELSQWSPSREEYIR